MNTTTKVILGMTVAAAAGAAIGMLLAPEKGSDLQLKMKTAALNWLSEFATLLSTGKEFTSELTDRTQRSVSELAGGFVGPMVDDTPHLNR